MNATPMTIEEWEDYILNGIPVEDLVHQARVSGSNAFLRMMAEEGYEAKDLLVIHHAFALRFVSEDMRVPAQMDGCHVNFNAMVENPDSDLQEKIALLGLTQKL